jgi:small conductance mechanosensitive channel
LVDVLLPLDVDVDRALALMKEEMEALARDPEWEHDIVEQPQVLGVEAMSGDGLTIRLIGRTVPQRQDAFARLMRSRIAARLRREGIPLAKPPVVAAPAAGDDSTSSAE